MGSNDAAGRGSLWTGLARKVLQRLDVMEVTPLMLGQPPIIAVREGDAL